MLLLKLFISIESIKINILDFNLLIVEECIIFIDKNIFLLYFDICRILVIDDNVNK